jgi:23S rRNA 5-hydroxycytidine C2501 synthase
MTGQDVRPGTELLAPARDLVCGRIAIDAGADAVYIGAPRFGARAKAGNTLDDIADLIAYAHTYWARVYVTVNTLLHDDEIAAAASLIRELHRIKADAVIIQDVGLLEIDLPPIPLIASTQMHNHTPERVRFLEAIGFHRAILARELTLGEIRAIREATTTIELEAFVHGALCVSYSGQCYMSYAIGGRSGNRGECAQPCRRRYDLVDQDGRVLVHNRYLLSLHDMSRLTDLGALLDAGVTSFKIEGRLKDETYVANVVSAYREALDLALAIRQLPRSSSGQNHIPWTPNIHKTFNRGYTDYFLHGRAQSPGSIDTPKMVGEALGSVTHIERKTFTLKTGINIHSGDGLAFFDETGALHGTVVNGSHSTRQGVVIEPNEMNGVHIGTRIYRNHDHTFLTEARRQVPIRTIGVLFVLRETAEGIQIAAEDEDGNKAQVERIQENVPARKVTQAIETAQRQLGKIGGTPFHCEGVMLDWEQPLFLPFSILNELRREVLDRLLKVRAARRPTLTTTIHKNTVPYPATSLTFRANALNERARDFYHGHGVTEIEPAAESGLDLTGRGVMTTRYCIREELGLCPQQDHANYRPGQLFLVDGDGHRYRVDFHCDQAPDGCGMDIIY